MRTSLQHGLHELLVQVHIIACSRWAHDKLNECLAAQAAQQGREHIISRQLHKGVAPVTRTCKQSHMWETQQPSSCLVSVEV